MAFEPDIGLVDDIEAAVSGSKFTVKKGSSRFTDQTPAVKGKGVSFDSKKGLNVNQLEVGGLVYQSADKTLTDKEIEKAHQKIEGRLRHVLKAQIRGKDGV